MEPRNLIMVINDLYGLSAALSQGYKLLLCTEDSIDPVVITHPNIIKASILLPPFEALNCEANCDINSAMAAYGNYLMTHPQVSEFLKVVYVSAYVMQQPICLYLGTEYNDLQLVSALPKLLEGYYGISFTGYINTQNLIPILESMYLGGSIAGMQTICYWPNNVQFTPAVLEKLKMELRPPVQWNDVNALNEHFHQLRDAMTGQTRSAYGQALYSPFIGGSQ